MSNNLFALLIHGHPEPFESLKRNLKDLSVDTYSVENCKDADDLIYRCKPHLVFAENCMADGSWLSILKRAEAENVPTSIIVVAAYPDMRLYVAVMEKGAFDYVAPPFEHESLERVIHSAVLDTCRRRKVLTQLSAN